MFNFTDHKEERHERIAQKAANLCKREHYDPTDALRKVAQDNALNDAETEDVCAKLNHILFKEKFAEDKLAVFNAAQYNKVNVNEGEIKTAATRMDVGKGYIDDLHKRAQEIQYMPTEDAVIEQPDPIMEDAEQKARGHDLNRFIEQATENASEITAHHMAIDNIVEEMKGRILSLYREGVPLEEVFNTILMAVGESQASAVEEYFIEMMDQLKQEGLMDPNEKLFVGDPEKVAADFSSCDKLTKMAKDLKMHIDKAVIKEAAHEYAINELHDAGYTRICDRIDSRVDNARILSDINSRYTIDMDKIAMSISPKVAGISNKIIPDKVKDNVLAALALAGATAVVGATTAAGTEGYRAAKKAIIKKKLPNNYPELRDIPTNKYNDLYDTITALNPTLVKAPYALSEMIKRYSEYGTIDTGNILHLQNANKPGPTFSDYAVEPARKVMTDYVMSRLKSSDNAASSSSEFRPRINPNAPTL